MENTASSKPCRFACGDFLRDRRGFTGAEKALLSCFGLAVVSLAGFLIHRGSEEAASDARRTLSGEGRVASAWQKVLQPMQAGVMGQPGSLVAQAGLRAVGLGLSGSGLPMPRSSHVEVNGSGHIMPMRGSGPENLTNKAAPTDANLKYYGGHVISNVKVVLVYWENGANKVDPALKDQLPGFYKSVVDNPYIDWLSEYDTTSKTVDGKDGTNQHIGRGSYGGAVTVTPGQGRSGNSITNSDIQAEINAQIDAGNLPPPDANTLYMIHFPKQVGIDLDGSKSCQQFCAYHNTLSRNGQSVYYGVMPDVGAGSACASGCGSSANSFDNATSVASHELIEAVTDPEVGLATTSGPPLGWYDDKYGEIGDICNAEQGTLPGTSYTVQKEYSNKNGGCIVSPADGNTVSTNITPPKPNQPAK